MKEDLKLLCGKMSKAVDEGDKVGFLAAKVALDAHRGELERLAKTAKGQDQATAKAALALLDPKKDDGVGFDLDGGTKEPSKKSDEKKTEIKVDVKAGAVGGEEPTKDDDVKVEIKVLDNVDTNPPDGELQPEVEDPAPRPVRAGGGDDGPRQPRRREANESGGFNWWWVVLFMILLVIAVLVGQKIGGGGAADTPTPTATTTPLAPPAMTKEDLIDAYNAASEKNRQKDLEALATEMDKTTEALNATDKTQVKSVSEYRTCAEEPNQPSCLAGEAEERKFYGDLSPKKADK